MVGSHNKFSVEDTSLSSITEYLKGAEIPESNTLKHKEFHPEYNETPKNGYPQAETYWPIYDYPDLNQGDWEQTSTAKIETFEFKKLYPAQRKAPTGDKLLKVLPNKKAIQEYPWQNQLTESNNPKAEISYVSIEPNSVNDEKPNNDITIAEYAQSYRQNDPEESIQFDNILKSPDHYDDSSDKPISPRDTPENRGEQFLESKSQSVKPLFEPNESYPKYHEDTEHEYPLVEAHDLMYDYRESHQPWGQNTPKEEAIYETRASNPNQQRRLSENNFAMAHTPESSIQESPKHGSFSESSEVTAIDLLKPVESYPEFDDDVRNGFIPINTRRPNNDIPKYIRPYEQIISHGQTPFPERARFPNNDHDTLNTQFPMKYTSRNPIQLIPLRQFPELNAPATESLIKSVNPFLEYNDGPENIEYIQVEEDDPINNYPESYLLRDLQTSSDKLMAYEMSTPSSNKQGIFSNNKSPIFGSLDTHILEYAPTTQSPFEPIRSYPEYDDKPIDEYVPIGTKNVLYNSPEYSQPLEKSELEEQTPFQNGPSFRNQRVDNPDDKFNLEDAQENPLEQYQRQEQLPESIAPIIRTPFKSNQSDPQQRKDAENEYSSGDTTEVIDGYPQFNQVWKQVDPAEQFPFEEKVSYTKQLEGTFNNHFTETNTPRNLIQGQDQRQNVPPESEPSISNNAFEPHESYSQYDKNSRDTLLPDDRQLFNDYPEYDSFDVQTDPSGQTPHADRPPYRTQNKSPLHDNILMRDNTEISTQEYQRKKQLSESNAPPLISFDLNESYQEPYEKPENQYSALEAEDINYYHPESHLFLEQTTEGQTSFEIPETYSSQLKNPLYDIFPKIDSSEKERDEYASNNQFLHPNAPREENVVNTIKLYPQNDENTEKQYLLKEDTREPFYDYPDYNQFHPTQEQNSPVKETSYEGKIPYLDQLEDSSEDGKFLIQDTYDNPSQKYSKPDQLLVFNEPKLNNPFTLTEQYPEFDKHPKSEYLPLDEKVQIYKNPASDHNWKQITPEQQRPYEKNNFSPSQLDDIVLLFDSNRQLPLEVGDLVRGNPVDVYPATSNPTEDYFRDFPQSHSTEASTEPIGSFSVHYGNPSNVDVPIDTSEPIFRYAEYDELSDQTEPALLPPAWIVTENIGSDESTSDYYEFDPRKDRITTDKPTSFETNRKFAALNSKPKDVNTLSKIIPEGLVDKNRRTNQPTESYESTTNVLIGLYPMSRENHKTNNIPLDTRELITTYRRTPLPWERNSPLTQIESRDRQPNATSSFNAENKTISMVDTPTVQELESRRSSTTLQPYFLADNGPSNKNTLSNDMVVPPYLRQTNDALNTDGPKAQILLTTEQTYLNVRPTRLDEGQLRMPPLEQFSVEQDPSAIKFNVGYISSEITPLLTAMNSTKTPTVKHVPTKSNIFLARQPYVSFSPSTELHILISSDDIPNELPAKHLNEFQDFKPDFLEGNESSETKHVEFSTETPINLSGHYRSQTTLKNSDMLKITDKHILIRDQGLGNKYVDVTSMYNSKTPLSTLDKTLMGEYILSQDTSEEPTIGQQKKDDPLVRYSLDSEKFLSTTPLYKTSRISLRELPKDIRPFKIAVTLVPKSPFKHRRWSTILDDNKVKRSTVSIVNSKQSGDADIQENLNAKNTPQYNNSNVSTDEQITHQQTTTPKPYTEKTGFEAIKPLKLALPSQRNHFSNAKSKGIESSTPLKNVLSDDTRPIQDIAEILLEPTWKYVTSQTYSLTSKLPSTDSSDRLINRNALTPIPIEVITMSLGKNNKQLRELLENSTNKDALKDVAQKTTTQHSIPLENSGITTSIPLPLFEAVESATPLHENSAQETNSRGNQIKIPVLISRDMDQLSQMPLISSNLPFQPHSLADSNDITTTEMPLRTNAIESLVRGETVWNQNSEAYLSVTEPSFNFTAPPTELQNIIRSPNVLEEEVLSNAVEQSLTTTNLPLSTKFLITKSLHTPEKTLTVLQHHPLSEHATSKAPRGETTDGHTIKGQNSGLAKSKFEAREPSKDARNGTNPVSQSPLEPSKSQNEMQDGITEREHFSDKPISVDADDIQTFTTNVPKINSSFVFKDSFDDYSNHPLSTSTREGNTLEEPVNINEKKYIPLTTKSSALQPQLRSKEPPIDFWNSPVNEMFTTEITLDKSEKRRLQYSLPLKKDTIRTDLPFEVISMSPMLYEHSKAEMTANQDVRQVITERLLNKYQVTETSLTLDKNPPDYIDYTVHIHNKPVEPSFGGLSVLEDLTRGPSEFDFTVEDLPIIFSEPSKDLHKSNAEETVVNTVPSADSNYNYSTAYRSFQRYFTEDQTLSDTTKPHHGEKENDHSEVSTQGHDYSYPQTTEPQSGGKLKGPNLLNFNELSTEFLYITSAKSPSTSAQKSHTGVFEYKESSDDNRSEEQSTFRLIEPYRNFEDSPLEDESKKLLIETSKVSVPLSEEFTTLNGTTEINNSVTKKMPFEPIKLYSEHPRNEVVTFENTPKQISKNLEGAQRWKQEAPGLEPFNISKKPSSENNDYLINTALPVNVQDSDYVNPKAEKPHQKQSVSDLERPIFTDNLKDEEGHQSLYGFPSTDRVQSNAPEKQIQFQLRDSSQEYYNSEIDDVTPDKQSTAYHYREIDNRLNETNPQTTKQLQNNETHPDMYNSPVTQTLPHKTHSRELNQQEPKEYQASDQKLSVNNEPYDSRDAHQDYYLPTTKSLPIDIQEPIDDYSKSDQHMKQDFFKTQTTENNEPYPGLRSNAQNNSVVNTNASEEPISEYLRRIQPVEAKYRNPYDDYLNNMENDGLSYDKRDPPSVPARSSNRDTSQDESPFQPTEWYLDLHGISGDENKPINDVPKKLTKDYTKTDLPLETNIPIVPITSQTPYPEVYDRSVNKHLSSDKRERFYDSPDIFPELGVTSHEGQALFKEGEPHVPRVFSNPVNDRTHFRDAPIEFIQGLPIRYELSEENTPLSPQAPFASDEIHLTRHFEPLKNQHQLIDEPPIYNFPKTDQTWQQNIPEAATPIKNREFYPSSEDLPLDGGAPITFVRTESKEEFERRNQPLETYSAIHDSLYEPKALNPEYFENLQSSHLPLKMRKPIYEYFEPDQKSKNEAPVKPMLFLPESLEPNIQPYDRNSPFKLQETYPNNYNIPINENLPSRDIVMAKYIDNPEDTTRKRPEDKYFNPDAHYQRPFDHIRRPYSAFRFDRDRFANSYPFNRDSMHSNYANFDPYKPEQHEDVQEEFFPFRPTVFPSLPSFRTQKSPPDFAPNSYDDHIDHYYPRYLDERNGMVNSNEKWNPTESYLRRRPPLVHDYLEEPINQNADIIQYSYPFRSDDNELPSQQRPNIYDASYGNQPGDFAEEHINNPYHIIFSENYPNQQPYSKEISFDEYNQPLYTNQPSHVKTQYLNRANIERSQTPLSPRIWNAKQDNDGYSDDDDSFTTQENFRSPQDTSNSDQDYDQHSIANKPMGIGYSSENTPITGQNTDSDVFFQPDDKSASSEVERVTERPEVNNFDDDHNISLQTSDKSEKCTEHSSLNDRPCTAQGFFRYLSFCNRFYKCTYNDACNRLEPSDVYFCAKCLQFSEMEHKCVLPELVPECTYLNISEHKSFAVRIDSKQTFCTGEGRFAIPDYPSKYYDCQWNPDKNIIDLVVRDCQLGEVWDEPTKSCQMPEFAHPHRPCQQHQDGFVGDTKDCNQLYHCTEGHARALFCPTNYAFNGHYCESIDISKFIDWNTFLKSINVLT